MGHPAPCMTIMTHSAPALETGGGSDREDVVYRNPTSNKSTKKLYWSILRNVAVLGSVTTVSPLKIKQ